MLSEPVYLNAGLYPKYSVEIAALASEGYNIVLIQNPFRCKGKSFAPKIELPKAVEFSEPTRHWIDEAPNVGTIGQTPEPRLSFLSKCMRQHFGIELDLTIKTNSLFFL